jgi:hypothetical protein
MAPNAFVATYASPIATQTFSQALPSRSSDSKSAEIQEKTAFLSALRNSAAQMQTELNAYLTEKMEEDKAASGEKSGENGKAQEFKEEEMYGDEDAEQDG